jgi:calcineurin-like phosphoesterase family protein
MSNLFFTSDHHFGHKNIIKFSNRPFENVNEMDEVMIQRWNEKVQPDDEVYHLGDLAFRSKGSIKKVLDRLNGKIYLIKGNHEKLALTYKFRFEWIKDYFELVVDDPEFKRGHQMIVLFHYAIKQWNKKHHGSYHLYGHSHGSLPDDIQAQSFDIGVDCYDFYPLSYTEVKAIMKEKEWVPPFARENR